MPDTFESKFSKVIQTQIQEKLPSLVPYEVGFQLIDKTEDEKKAVGIAAFVVNDVWLYVLSFFLEGKIKGMDIMYVKNADTTVPANDSWVSLFKEEAGRIFGFLREKNDTDGADMGSVEIDDEFIEKSSNNFVFTEDLQKMLSNDMSFNFKKWTDIPSQLKDMGKTASACFSETLINNPEFANSVFTYYKPSELSKIASQLVEQKVKEVSPEGKVTFIESIEDAAAGDLSSKEKKLLLRNGVYVKDKRKSFSTVFYDQVRDNITANPNSTGVYELLMADGSYKPFIVFKLSDVAKERDRGKDIGFKMALVDLDRPRKFILRRSSKIFGRSLQDYADVKKKLSSITIGYEPNITSLINALPNKDREHYPGARITDILFVKGQDQAYYGTVTHNEAAQPKAIYLKDRSFEDQPKSALAEINTADGMQNWEYPEDKVYVDFTDSKGKLKRIGEKLYVPMDARILVSREIDEEDDYNFGTPQTIYGDILKTASCSNLDIQYRGCDDYLIVYKDQRDLLNKTAALKNLICHKGIFAGEAQKMLKKAEHKGMTKWILKEAATAIDERPESARETNAVTETTSKGISRNVLTTDQVTDVVEASREGIKEVFDVSIIKAILSKVSIDELKSDYLAKLVQAMDRAGRLLLLFYWHQDHFEAQYGKSDLKNLENSIRDLFLQLGEVVFFLREKSLSSNYLIGDSGDLVSTLSDGEAGA